MKLNKFVAALATAAGLFSLTPTAFAAWPDDGPIEVVVGFAPGGGTDLMARKLAPFIQKHLGGKGQFVVVNKPGAAGELASAHVAKAKPDGYTIAVVNLPSFFFVPMMKKTQYSTDDFQLVSRVVDDPTVLAVRTDSKYSNLQAVVAQSNQSPSSVSVGHNGAGTNGELVIDLMAQAGVKLNPIPYKGSSAQKTDLLGGHLDIAIVSAGEVPELHDGAAKGQFRALAQFTAKRSSVLPQVQTANESGVSVLMSSERGFAVPKGVPADIVKRLDNAIAAALKDPGYLGQSTDDKVISYMTGTQWQQVMEQSRKALLPLANAQPKN